MSFLILTTQTRILTLVFVRIVDQVMQLINSLKVAILKIMKIFLDQKITTYKQLGHILKELTIIPTII